MEQKENKCITKNKMQQYFLKWGDAAPEYIHIGAEENKLAIAVHLSQTPLRKLRI